MLLGQTRDVHDDDGDVVVAAPGPPPRSPAERRSAEARCGWRGSWRFVIFQHGGKAIGAQKQAVAGFHGDFEEIRLVRGSLPKARVMTERWG